jgi:putative ABC transport system permease protein
LTTNYLKVAFRNLTKHPLYSSINIGGLAVGITCTILILLWVRDELSYDRFHPEAENIYRMNWDFKLANAEGVGRGTPPPLATALAREVPGVVAATRLRNMANTVVRSQDKFFSESGIMAADSNMFDLFGFQLVIGNPKTVLMAPNSVILTEKAAPKYFGNEPAVGKFLSIGEKVHDLYGTYQNLFTVTGVVKNPPHNSHIQFDMLTSMSSYPEVAWRDWSWMWMQMATYVKLEESASLPDAEARVQEAVKKSLSVNKRGISLAEIMRNNWRWNFVFQPMTDIYLRSVEIGNRLGPTGNRLYVYLFGTIACFILLIACVNFMNLATARSSTRAREVGMRKVLGSERRMLVAQFLVESLVFSALAMLLALLLVEALVEPFNILSGKALHFNLFDPPWLLAALVLLTLLVALIAGSYPSVYLSSFRPLHAFKRMIRLSNRHWSLRNVLVMLQFTITIGLIACTVLVQRQLNYVRSVDLGFKKDGIVIISNVNNRLGDQVNVFKEILKSHSQVINASVSTGVPPYEGFEDSYKGEGKGDKPFDLISYMTDEDFVNTLGINIIQGRGFAREFSTNASGVILNEAAVKYLGWENPLGKTITYPGGNNGTFQVIGVMKDFNFVTLRSPITPFALFHDASNSYQIPSSHVVVRIARDDMNGTIKLLESEWKAVAPTTPFEYEFLDRSLESQYEAENRFGNVFLVFSLLTIFIACIGLLGLVSFSTEQRTKEIGVRKVLGASVTSIVGLLSKEFIRLILIANVFAWPIAYIAMNRWLEDFSYRVEIGWWVFALSGGLALLIAILTVSFLAVRAALENPVESLRCE